LDWTTGREIVAFLKQINRAHKKTMVIVTHDERIVDLADVVVRLEQGRVVSVVRNS